MSSSPVTFPVLANHVCPVEAEGKSVPSSQPPSRPPSVCGKPNKRCKTVVQSPDTSDGEDEYTGTWQAGGQGPPGMFMFRSFPSMLTMPCLEHPAEQHPSRGSASVARDGSPDPNSNGDWYFKKADVARDLGWILGLDLTNSSTQFLQEAIKALPEEEDMFPIAVEKRYTQVCPYFTFDVQCLTIC
jgi:hypothetical protein